MSGGSSNGRLIRIATVASRSTHDRLRTLLCEAPDLDLVAEIVGAFGPDQVRHRVRLSRPEVVVINVVDRGVDPAALARTLVRRLPNPPAVLVVTDEARAADALRAGAGGILHTASYLDSPLQLVRAVRMVVAGYTVATPAAAGLRRMIPPPPSRMRVARLPKALTSREMGVLKLVAQGRSNAEISAVLSLSESTVKSHVQRVLSKLNLRNRVSAVIFAYETGLVCAGESGLPGMETG